VSVSTPKPGNSVLLDTTVVVQHFRATNLPLKNFLQAGGTVYLPLTVLAELHGGACRVTRKDRAIEQIRAFLLTTILLLPDEATAVTYGEIYAELAQAGTPIPQNDIWIAAQAREHGLPVATSDAHFGRVNGLAVLNWR
jgi:tRNA(fMet)-specific endonuclease VapC